MSSVNIQNYQIFQRDGDGFARIVYSGTYDGVFHPQDHVIVRVLSESNSAPVLPITEATTSIRDDVLNYTVKLLLPEGGLYRIEAILTENPAAYEWAPRIDSKYHIGVGDIYIMAGQSNMTGYGRDAAYDPPTLGVHLFRRSGKWDVASHPLSDSQDSPYGYREYSTASSPALSFARRLHEALGLPIGLIPAAVGGTPLSAWDPVNGTSYKQMRAMLHDAGNRFRGMIWYQGCSDATTELAPTYYDRFASFLAGWRRELGDFPILTVQLNLWAVCGKEEEDRSFGEIRDAQRRAAMTLPQTYVVPANDQTVTDGGHNSAAANVVIGERLATTALRCLYGKIGTVAPNVLSAHYMDETHIRIVITKELRVRSMDDSAFGMDVEDADGIIPCCRSHADGDNLIVSTERPYSLPAYFHYAWRAIPPVLVTRDINGMPLLSCYRVRIEAE